MPNDDKPKASPTTDSFDVVIPAAATDDGGIRALRARPGKLEVAEIRPVKEGSDVRHAELVRLSRREDAPQAYNVDVVYDGRPEPTESTRPTTRRAGRTPGPARIANESYRRNWEQIFGAKPN